MIDEIRNAQLFDLKRTIARELFCGCDYPFEVLGKLKDYIIELGKNLPKAEFYSPKENVWISRGASVDETAYIGERCIICSGAEIRKGAFIRGSAIVGKEAVVGNSTELKNAVLFDNVQVPHYNYIGDSVLGFHAHMGAGAVTSNIKSDKKNVVIKGGDFEIATNLRKCGAFIGDFVEVGCNCVLNPGCVIGVNSRIYPLNSVRGVVPCNVIYKNAGEFEKIREFGVEI
ncbi:MAG: UDP-N-acetylglucosamine pyrophosphorylase [Clostridia bacterium]